MVSSNLNTTHICLIYIGAVFAVTWIVHHMWSGFTHTDLLESMESKAFHLNNSPTLNDSLQSPSCRWIVVASLSKYSL